MPADDPTVHHIETPTSGRLLVRSPNKRPIAGVWVGFHGYAESAETHFNRMARVEGLADWVLVSVQALNRFYRGRSEETVASWMTRQDREVAIAMNIAYVDRAIDWVRRNFNLPIAESATGDRCFKGTVPLLYSGFSQGTAMAFRAAVRGRWRAEGLVAVGGDVPPELLADPDARFPPVLLARGARDEWYTQAKLDADVAALTAAGAPVTPLVFDGGHEWPAALSGPIARFMASVRGDSNLDR